MKSKLQIGLCAFIFLFTLAPFAAGQNPSNAAPAKGMAAAANEWKARLGPNIHHLSGAAQNFLKSAGHWEFLRALARSSARIEGPAPSLIAPQSELPLAAGPGPQQAITIIKKGPASQPHLSFTRFSGAVQSETSMAWCGTNAMVGFNDSGSLWETSAGSASAGTSFVGYAVSQDGGKSFDDKGFPQVGPAMTQMAGDPVVACADPNTFFYSSLYQDSSTPGPSGVGFSGVSLSISTNGGQSFAPPAIAVEKDFFYHLIDKDWMTIDSAHPKDIFITYTDFDVSNNGSSGNVCGAGGSGIPRSAIELVSSTDGGNSWSNPTVVVEVCDTSYVEGSQVIVAPTTGAVYVVWELFGNDPTAREIDIAKSQVGGTTFSPPLRISKVHPVGGAGLFVPSLPYYLDLEGAIRDFEFPSIGFGKGPNAGNLYVTWNDGDVRTADALVQQFQSSTFDGKYGFSDVLLSASQDAGSTWSAPLMVNAPSPSSAPTDHFQPSVGVDRNGTIGICWYDRNRDTNNILIDRKCATSTGGGKTWNKLRITNANYPSVTNQDAMTAPDYQGDYDQLASDATDAHLGFLEGFVNTHLGNQSVIVGRFLGL